MYYVLMRREISKYLITAISCRHLFNKIEGLEDNEVKLDFSLIYYISNEFIETYQTCKALSTKNVIAVNLPYYFRNKFS